MTLDLYRQLILQSLACFNAYKSEESGFIHLYCHAPYGLRHDTIPILHNFLYVLCLLKSSNVALMQEGFRLLHHLLHFQNEGKFPFYLHDYPFVRISSDQLDCLVVLDRISAYSSVMDQKLSDQLEGALQRLKAVVLETEWMAPLDTFRKALFFNLEQGGYEPKSSKELSSLIPLGFPVSSYFSTKTKSYMGPLTEEMWYKDQPERTFFHDYMVMSTEGKIPSEINPCQMFYPLIERFSPLNEQAKPFILTSMEENTNPYLAVFEHVFSSLDKIFYFTCYKQQFHFRREGNELFFTLTKPFDPYDAKDPHIVFYLNYPELAKVFVNGERALVFYEGEEVSVQIADKKITLTFHYNTEEMDAVGIVLRGNRPTQLFVDKFSAYDLMIGLRMPRWTVGSLVRVSISIM